jgi:[acyl-carrier-protein] S-malonyltransferase
MKAFVFPGQGSQKVGMGKDIVEGWKLAEEIYKTADQVLGFSLSGLSFNGPEDELGETRNTQPALLTYSYAVSEILMSRGFRPDFVAGHSLGEFSAILCAGMLTFDDALRIVRRRGELMAAADPEGRGSMAVVLGLDDEKVKAVCAEVSKTAYVEPVNFNCPGQVAISGIQEGIAAAEVALKAAGAKRVLKLAVSGAFHSKLMEKAADEFRTFLGEFRFNKPRCKVVSNVTAGLEDETDIVELLVRQMKSPVLWSDSVRFMKQSGVTSTVEVGFGSVVTGLVKKIDSGIQAQTWQEVLQ